MREIRFNAGMGYEDEVKYASYDDGTPDAVVESDFEAWRNELISGEWREITKVQGQYMAHLTINFDIDKSSDEYTSFAGLHESLENGTFTEAVKQAIQNSIGSPPTITVRIEQEYGNIWEAKEKPEQRKPFWM